MMSEHLTKEEMIDFVNASDSVNHPPHYKQGKVECIDAIKAALGDEGFYAYCKGQVIKYLWRADHKKNRVEDLCKAGWYMDRLVADQCGCAK